MTTTADHTRPRNAEAPRRSVEDVQRTARIRELENELSSRNNVHRVGRECRGAVH
jgi:hypothetical protein